MGEVVHIEITASLNFRKCQLCDCRIGMRNINFSCSSSLDMCVCQIQVKYRKVVYVKIIAVLYNIVYVNNNTKRNTRSTEKITIDRFYYREWQISIAISIYRQVIPMCLINLTFNGIYVFDY